MKKIGAKKINVFVVDDSAVVRQVLTELLQRDPELDVIGVAADPVYAAAKMQNHWPDVIVLDVEMPRMDGITYLRKIMAERPTPVVICSTLTVEGAATTMDALAAGAFTIVAKPTMGLKQFLHDSVHELIAAVKSAASIDARKLRSAPKAAEPSRAAAARPTAIAALNFPGPHSMSETTERIVAIGTSTGGTHALETVLTSLPLGCPGIAIVQHMPEKFTAAFAERLDKICKLTVREANNGERLLPGHVLIAPGGKHLLLKRSGAYYHAEVVDGPHVNRHKPSVDVLFRSVASCAGRNALGIVMTGMGDDGARGLKEMRNAGGDTVAQDEASCVVFGMPKEAIRMGAAAQVLPLSELAHAILNWSVRPPQNAS